MATSNAFTATLTGAKAVTLELRRMQLSTHRPLTGTVKTEAPLALTLDGVAGGVSVTVDGQPATTSRDGRALTVDVPAGEHTVLVG